MKFLWCVSEVYCLKLGELNFNSQFEIRVLFRIGSKTILVRHVLNFTSFLPVAREAYLPGQEQTVPEASLPCCGLHLDCKGKMLLEQSK